MKLEKLFEAQKELSQKIVETKGLQGKDLLDEKILALQVELGELANEWRGFKFWSEDREPRTLICPDCKGSGMSMLVETGCPTCRGVGRRDRNPLLEEYVDCLHFILDIGIDLGINDVEVTCNYTAENTTETFNLLFYTFSELWTYINSDYVEKHYKILFQMFIGLGEQHLGFTWDQIEEEYYRKNKINHARQENGY